MAISSSWSLDEVVGGRVGEDGGLGIGAGASLGVDDEAERGLGGCHTHDVSGYFMIALTSLIRKSPQKRVENPR